MITIRVHLDSSARVIDDDNSLCSQILPSPDRSLLQGDSFISPETSICCDHSCRAQSSIRFLKASALTTKTIEWTAPILVQASIAMGKLWIMGMYKTTRSPSEPHVFSIHSQNGRLSVELLQVYVRHFVGSSDSQMRAPDSFLDRPGAHQDSCRTH